MSTTTKGILYIIIAIVIYSVRQYVFTLANTSTIFLFQIILTLIAFGFLINGIHILIKKKSSLNTSDIENNKQKNLHIILTFIGLGLTGAVVWLPALVCTNNSDFVCGTEHTFIGMFLSAIGLWLFIYGISKLFKKLNKKIF